MTLELLQEYYAVSHFKFFPNEVLQS